MTCVPEVKAVMVCRHSVACGEAPLDLPKWRCLQCFASASWGDLTRYADFPWNDYYFRFRDPTLCAECITEVIVFVKLNRTDPYTAGQSGRHGTCDIL
ncbi:hypothetical protein E2C01_040931 [Portunus trituberculatus]|uniref:Uncharacterized protein n=1 Tax=Portunus trituberculatus TaxID=210409 RepID=A0A5B7FS45_PORTR|nr:hypothetical protein [Portunus trituberculatus]